MSAAPLPDSVKVARRPVKPLVLVRVQVWQPISGCNVSSRRPCSERGGRRCNSCHPDHFWNAGRYKLAAPVSKTGSARAEVGALPTPSATVLSVNAKQLAQPAFQVGPNRCKSDHGCQPSLVELRLGEPF